MSKKVNFNKASTYVIIAVALLLGFIISRFPKAPSEPENAPLTLPVEHTADTLSVYFVDVGQADCQIVLLPTGQTMIIDAGNNDDDRLICQYLDALHIQTIDYLVGTHPHEDHIGAMDVIIENYNVTNVYMPDATSDTQTFYDVKAALLGKGITPIYIKAGSVIYSDDTLKIEVVAPVNNYEDNLNNMSTVIRITYKESSFLFTGDIEEEAEHDITMDISADVLSVPHHGSSTSTTDSFLHRVDPMYAVISCGVNNDYGHPHWETLEKLRNDDVTIYRTDTMGTITCSTKGAKGDYVWTGIK